MEKYLNDRNIVVSQVGRKKGKFILFVRSGENIPLCLENYIRNEDIIVVLSFYQERNFSVEPDFWVISGGLSKFDSARLFFHKFPELKNYLGYAFFDPDVAIKFNEIALLFSRGLADEKGIFQAAVEPKSHTFWRFLYKKNMSGWREVSFIEVMAPFFSNQALNLTLGGFSSSISTWGLEYDWYAKCDRMSMAVFDSLSMRHETPVDLSDGPFYKYLSKMGIDPFHELSKLKNKNVGYFYVECEIPSWIPMFAKKSYVRVLALRARLRQRISVTRFEKFFS